jgi:serine/threonine protein kinase
MGAHLTSLCPSSEDRRLKNQTVPEPRQSPKGGKKLDFPNQPLAEEEITTQLRVFKNQVMPDGRSTDPGSLTSPAKPIKATKSDDNLSKSRGQSNCPTFTCDDFDFHKVLGEGAFGKVYLSNLKNKPELPFAIKVIQKCRFTESSAESAQNEKRVLELISDESSRFLTKLYCTFQTSHNLFFCLEYLPGGTLRKYLDYLGKFSSQMAAFLGAQLVLGLSFLHERLNIVHRDLKLENILVDSEGYIKFTDFGLSKIGKIESHTFCGTLNYLAPELIKHQPYNRMVDFWMLGCMLYEMLVGKPPFEHKNKKTLLDMICAGMFKASAVADPVAKDLISKLLSINPITRLGANGSREVMKHPFFKDIDFTLIGQGKLESPLKMYVRSASMSDKIIKVEYESGSAKTDKDIFVDDFSWVKRKTIVDPEEDY